VETRFGLCPGREDEDEATVEGLGTHRLIDHDVDPDSFARRRAAEEGDGQKEAKGMST
jgi:hypothetical protein